MRFESKVAVITGAGDGIGKAVTKIMAVEGGQVAAVDISGPALAALAEEIELGGGQITTIEADVLDIQQARNMVDKVLEAWGKIDILVNAVGGSTIISPSDAPVDDLAMDDWDKIINFNLRGTFLCTNAVMGQMKKQGSGKIINISSIAGHGVSESSSSAYAAAKAGIIGFTKKVAKEGGPYGITCNAIAPGLTLSNRIKPRWTERSAAEQQSFIESIPLRRVAHPEDQAKVITFLASEDADYVTGVTIDVSGGQY